MTKILSEWRLRGQFAFSQQCLFCRKLMERDTCSLCSGSDRGAVILHTVAFTKNRWFLTDSQGNRAHAVHRHMHTQRSFPPAEGHVQVCPGSHMVLYHDYALSSFNFFHHATLRLPCDAVSFPSDVAAVACSPRGPSD